MQGDRDRLAQMLWNLVENALRYTDPGGTVTLGLHNHGSVAELTVADTGVGIPAEHLPHIFERFYRVERARSHRDGSTGLGLAIVKQVAEAHGGQVRVRSEPGAGTTFTVALPITATEPPLSSRHPPRPSPICYPGFTATSSSCRTMASQSRAHGARPPITTGRPFAGRSALP